MRFVMYSWSLLNCIFGAFPSTFTPQVRQIPCCIWLFIVALNVVVYCRMFYVICPQYGAPGAELLKYQCYLSWIINLTVLLHRATVFKPTVAVFRLTGVSALSPSFLTHSACVVALQFLVALIKTVTLFSTWFSVVDPLSVADIVCSYLFGMLPCFVMLQCVCICGVVRAEVNNICDLMSSAPRTKRDVAQIKTKISLVNRIFSHFLRVYAVDAFLTVVSTSVFACVALHGMLLTTALFFFQSTTKLKDYMFQTAALSGSLASSVVILFYFCKMSSDITEKVKSSQKAAYKISHGLEEPIAEEVLLLLEQVENLNLSVNACGFFQINIKVFFKGLTKALTITILLINFIQMAMS